VKECFEEYLRDIEDKLILMRSKEKKAPLVKDYEVRFSKKRLRKARWQLGGIKIECGTHLVLTVDPSLYRNVVECVKGLRKEWNDLRRWIERRKKVKRLSYIEVLEFGKKHDLPHLHVLLGRIFFDEADLAALYKKRNEQRIRVTRIRDYDALGYVLKYASKVYNDFEIVRESQAYLYWVTDAKVYGMSRDHYQTIKQREVALTAFGWFFRLLEGEAYEGYEFVGIFDYCTLDPPPVVTACLKITHSFLSPKNLPNNRSTISGAVIRV
jgi:hypothetical protein